MRYGLSSRVMWLVFHRSFQKKLCIITDNDPKLVMRKASIVYQTILRDIPEFDKNDQFIMNILSAAMLASIYLSLNEKPDLDSVTTYYHRAMTENMVMRFFKKAKYVFCKGTNKIGTTGQNQSNQNQSLYMEVSV